MFSFNHITSRDQNEEKYWEVVDAFADVPFGSQVGHIYHHFIFIFPLIEKIIIFSKFFLLNSCKTYQKQVFRVREKLRLHSVLKTIYVDIKSMLTDSMAIIFVTGLTVI
jgi:hypothetical protein